MRDFLSFLFPPQNFFVTKRNRGKGKMAKMEKLVIFLSDAKVFLLHLTFYIAILWV